MEVTVDDGGNTHPRIVASRDGYRLVHRRRDPQSWPNISDLVLEEECTDAMGETHWVNVDSWCLTTTQWADITAARSDRGGTFRVALKMLLDTGPVVTDKRR